MTKKKNGETETKRVLDNLRMPKVQEIFTTVSVVCRRYERLPVLQMFSPSFCLERVKMLKNVSKKLHEYKLRQGRKEEAETKRSIWDLKKNPRTVKGYNAGVCISLNTFLINV